MGQNSDNAAVLLHFLQLCLNVFFPIFRFIFLRIFSESFLFGTAPVLIESPPHLLTKMLGPNRVQTSKTTGCLDISNYSNHNHGWCFKDSYCLTCFLLVELWGGIICIRKWHRQCRSICSILMNTWGRKLQSCNKISSFYLTF